MKLAELGVLLLTTTTTTNDNTNNHDNNNDTPNLASFKFTPSFIAYYLFQDREFLYQISFSFTVLSLCTSETFLKL